jgi:hypothetical protein
MNCKFAEVFVKAIDRFTERILSRLEEIDPRPPSQATPSLEPSVLCNGGHTWAERTREKAKP